MHLHLKPSLSPTNLSKKAVLLVLWELGLKESEPPNQVFLYRPSLENQQNKPQNDKSPHVPENIPEVQQGCRESTELPEQVWSLFVRVSNGALRRGSAHMLKSPLDLAGL